jgi:hypothetical protein
VDSHTLRETEMPLPTRRAVFIARAEEGNTPYTVDSVESLGKARSSKVAPFKGVQPSRLTRQEGSESGST